VLNQFQIGIAHLAGAISPVRGNSGWRCGYSHIAADSKL